MGAGLDTWLPVEVLVVSQHYPDIAGLGVVSGRWFTEADRAQQGRPIVVNDVLANRYFKRQDPIGQRLQLQSGSMAEALEIIGVVRDPRLLASDLGPRAIVYASWEQYPLANSSILVRANRDARGASTSIISRVSSALPPGASVSQARTGVEMLGAATAAASLMATVLLAVAAITGTFALAGIAALAHWQTTAKRREHGLRRALGATPSAIVGLQLRELARPVVIGLAAGALVGIASARAIERYVPSVECIRPEVWLASAAIYAAWAVLIGLSASLAALSGSVADDLMAW
jgi:ABC-type antimicrobial peptide transport system permease subunit